MAVDTDRDLAVVTNSLDDTASLVSLTPVIPDFSPESLGDTGIVGLPIPVGTTPEGVAVIPRLGVAMVTDNGSNKVTAIDLTSTPATPIPDVALCATCSGPAGVAFNQDTATAAVATTNAGTVFSTGNLDFLSVTRSTTTTPQVAVALGASPSVDQGPVAVAVDPTLNFAAVATASSTSSLDIVSMATDGIVGRVSSLQNPSGVVFDPVNQVFLTVNSLVNNIVITNPATLTSSNVSVGIAPTSVDYDFQTSSLVTVNAGSHVMSVLDYTCPPTVPAPACSDAAGPRGARTWEERRRQRSCLARTPSPLTRSWVWQCLWTRTIIACCLFRCRTEAAGRHAANRAWEQRIGMYWRAGEESSAGRGREVFSAWLCGTALTESN